MSALPTDSIRVTVTLPASLAARMDRFSARSLPEPLSRDQVIARALMEYLEREELESYSNRGIRG